MRSQMENKKSTTSTTIRLRRPIMENREKAKDIKEEKFKDFLKEISKSVKYGTKHQAKIPKLITKDENGGKIEFIKFNHHLERPEEKVEGFDFTKQRIRSIGFEGTGKSILAPKRDLNRYEIWNPEKINQEFLIKCAYLNQFLVEKKKDALTLCALKKYFEICGMDEAIFITSILNFEDKFLEYVKEI